MRIELPKAAFRQIVADPTSSLFPYLVYANFLGAQTKIVRNSAIVDFVRDHEVWRKQQVMEVLYQGGEFYNFPAWIEIAESIYDDNVPLALPNSTYTDEQGNEVRHTWRTWKDDIHPHLHAVDDTKHYVPSNANTNNRDLLGSELYQLSQAGFVLRDTIEIRNLDLADSGG